MRSCATRTTARRTTMTRTGLSFSTARVSCRAPIPTAPSSRTSHRRWRRSSASRQASASTVTFCRRRCVRTRKKRLDGLGRLHGLCRRVAMALICQATLGAAQTSHAGAPARPSLVVLISVDQMQATYYDRFKSQLTGGLARLYRGGAVFTSAWHDQAITQTAPGHAAMLTGRFPRSTGIINDTLGAPDEQETLVGGGGGGGASPYRLRGSALLDWMRNVDPKSRAFAVSRNNRSAILPAGRSHQEVFWYANDGRFTTSTYYADTLPTWLQQFNARKITSTYAGKTWTL